MLIRPRVLSFVRLPSVAGAYYPLGLLVFFLVSRRLHRFPIPTGSPQPVPSGDLHGGPVHRRRGRWGGGGVQFPRRPAGGGAPRRGRQAAVRCWAARFPGFLGVSARSRSSEQRALSGFVPRWPGAASPGAGPQIVGAIKIKGGQTPRGPPPSHPRPLLTFPGGGRSPPHPRPAPPGGFACIPDGGIRLRGGWAGRPRP